MSGSAYEVILREIERLHLVGDFTKVSEYISSLNDQVKHNQSVIIWAANHYVIVGHLAKAAKILNASNYAVLIERDGALLDENVAVLALLHARLYLQASGLVAA